MNAQIKNWDAIRSALAVIEHGTLSAAAKELRLHHATISRHIDSLEKELGVKLFHRHSHGYTPTEVGIDFESVGIEVRDQFSQFMHRLEGKKDQISGALTVTTISELAPLMTAWLAELHSLYPNLTIQLIADRRKLKLEYGEAHIAIRAGKKPQELDNVVQHFSKIELQLYAHKNYIAQHGMPKLSNDFLHHWFVIAGNQYNGSSLHTWLFKNIPAERIVFNSEDPLLVNEALYQGMGIGIHFNHPLITNKNLIPVMPSSVRLDSDLWLTTHRDLHHTEKVQTVLAFLKNKISTQFR